MKDPLRRHRPRGGSMSKECPVQTKRLCPAAVTRKTSSRLRSTILARSRLVHALAISSKSIPKVAVISRIANAYRNESWFFDNANGEMAEEWRAGIVDSWDEE
jgi:hypothetical protein